MLVDTEVRLPPPLRLHQLQLPMVASPADMVPVPLPLPHPEAMAE